MIRPARLAIATLALTLLGACTAPAPAPGPTTNAAVASPAPGDGAAPGQSAPPAGIVDPPGGRPAGTVFGTIVDPDGQPIPGVQISFLDPMQGVAGCCAEQPEPGTYTLDLSPGGHEIQFDATGFLPQDHHVVLAAGQRLRLDVVLLPGEAPQPARVVLIVDPDAVAGDLVSVEDVVNGGLSGTMTVSGILIGRAGGVLELCSAILESFPPQCGRPSLVIEGLDLTTLPDLQQSGGVVWLDRGLTLTGEVQQP